MRCQAMERHAGNWNACYQVKGASLKGDMLYNSNYMTFWTRQDYGDSKKTIGVRGQEMEDDR